MPRTRASAAAPVVREPEKIVEPEEQIDFNEDNEDVEEEEVEYEEVEVEEEVEEEEEEDEEDEEEENEGCRRIDSDDVATNADSEVLENDDDDKRTELLSLPPHGSEIYLGGINQDVSEDDVKQFCNPVGEVVEVRIMKGKESNQSKGYAFVTYRTKELASKAIKELNNTELKGRKVKCSAAQAKNRLFIGNVPRHWAVEDLKRVANKTGPGVVDVELVKDPHISNRNRGFAFIEYYNNACAEYSRQRMSGPDFKLDDNTPTVSWADPKSTDSSSTSQVKAVYVKNLPKTITQDQLKSLFQHHGKIIKVVLPPAKAGQEQSRYGFVHYAERSSAMKALKNTEKYEIDGKVLECSLAKPQADQSSGSNSKREVAPPAYPPRMGYGMVGTPYGAVGAGIGQSLLYGGAAPAGVAMMPLLLPDGRIGYVLQQPGALHTPPPPAPRTSFDYSGRNSSGGRRNSGGDSGRARSRYNPY